jgi:Fe-S cluster assembly protein SufD
MTTTLDSFIAEAERIGADRAPGGSAWLARARREALERFDTLGFPTTHDEEWRFTSVAPIAESRFALATDGASSIGREDLAAFGWRGQVAATLVFVNGHYAASVSDVARLPAGVRVESLAHALTRPSAAIEAHLTRVADSDRQAFTALNTAFLADGAFVHVPDGAAVDAPIHLLFLSAPDTHATMAHPRVLIVTGANSQATVVQSYGALRAGRHFTNGVTEVVAGEGSTLQHYTIQREGAASFHVGSMSLRAARDATLLCHSVALGGALVRNDVNVVLDGEGAGCTLNGLYLGDRDRLVDNHTTIDHARPNCASRELYKGILADRARAVFNGKIIVRIDAQKTDAKQTNKALLLSEDAHINTKPQLEIFANDVKCTHGAAIGQIDDEAIFYLRARGLGEREARQMLIRAFAGDVLRQMPLEPLRARLDEELARRLPEARS